MNIQCVKAVVLAYFRTDINHKKMAGSFLIFISFILKIHSAGS